MFYEGLIVLVLTRSWMVNRHVQGAHNRAGEEELRRLIRDAGLIQETARHAIPDIFSDLTLQPVARRNQAARLVSYIPVNPAVDCAAAVRLHRRPRTAEFAAFVFIEQRQELRIV